jgi:hypothetical protein
VAASKPSLLELAREARAAVRDRLGTVLVVVGAACLAALAIHAAAPVYSARTEVSFSALPAELLGRLDNPARVMTSGPVLADLESRLRQTGHEDAAQGLPGKLTVLQPADAERAELVAKGGSEEGARTLADAWAASFLTVRGRQVRAAFAQAERRLSAGMASARGTDRRALRERLMALGALERNLPGGSVASSAALTGSGDLILWSAPLVGLALGIALAAGLGLRDGRVRTRSLLGTLGGPALFARVVRPGSGAGLLGARLAALGRRRVVLSPVDGPPGSARALAHALDGDAAAAPEDVAEEDAWLVVVPLGRLTRGQLEQRFSELEGGRREPDGMVAVEERLASFRRPRALARRPSASR